MMQTQFIAKNEIPTLLLVPPASRALRVALALLVLALALLAGIVFLPWQQTVTGSGTVIAFAPSERRQTVESPIDGRVVEWHVNEGDAVAEGDLLVVLADNDPDLLERLESELAAANAMLTEYTELASTLESRVTTLTTRGDASVAGAQAALRSVSQSVRSAEQEVESAEASLTTALLQIDRVRSLHTDGLVSTRELELAELSLQQATNALESKRASLQSAREDRSSREASVQQAVATQQADVESALSSWRSALATVQSQNRTIIQLQSRLARQRTQEVRAPMAGMVFRVEALEGSQQVKSGDVLMTLIPDTEDRALELHVDGNDIPLVQVGSHVRIQFEGWPALQFAGWPSVAVGTFGGTVAVVDSADTGYGDFRVLVVPDPDSEHLWPDARYLRQGVRANAWFMLDVVPLYYEVWRRLNGFPASLQDAPAGAYATPSTPVQRGGKG
jgi:multidrug resistance efflux pump